MSAATGQTSNATVAWDSEPTKRQLREATDNFVDSMNPHAKALSKALSGVAVATSVNHASEGVKESVNSSLPNYAPIINTVVDITVVPATAFLANKASASVDGCVDRTAPVVKEKLNQTTDCSVDFYGRSVSIFK